MRLTSFTGSYAEPNGADLPLCFFCDLGSIFSSFGVSGSVLFDAGFGVESVDLLLSMSNILSKSISNINFNLYDNENIIIPFQSGHIIKVSMFEQNIDISQIQVEAGPLSDLKSADFNQDGYVDLILISGEQGIVTVSYGRSQNEPRLNEYFSVNGNNNINSPQIFSVIPEIIDQIYLGTVIAGGWNGEENELFYFESKLLLTLQFLFLFVL